MIPGSGAVYFHSPIRFASPGDAPSLIVYGDVDKVVPIVEGHTMYAALSKAGVPASFAREPHLVGRAGWFTPACRTATGNRLW
jgi:acetyl esterase/lipase